MLSHVRFYLTQVYTNEICSAFAEFEKILVQAHVLPVFALHTISTPLEIEV